MKPPCKTRKNPNLVQFEPKPAIPYTPSSHYWRKAIKAAQTVEEAQRLALVLVSELELHKAEFRANGLMPPKGCWAPGEIPYPAEEHYSRGGH